MDSDLKLQVGIDIDPSVDKILNTDIPILKNKLDGQLKLQISLDPTINLNPEIAKQKAAQLVSDIKNKFKELENITIPSYAASASDKSKNLFSEMYGGGDDPRFKTYEQDVLKLYENKRQILQELISLNNEYRLSGVSIENGFSQNIISDLGQLENLLSAVESKMKSLNANITQNNSFVKTSPITDSDVQIINTLIEKQAALNAEKLQGIELDEKRSVKTTNLDGNVVAYQLELQNKQLGISETHYYQLNEDLKELEFTGKRIIDDAEKRNKYLQKQNELHEQSVTKLKNYEDALTKLRYNTLESPKTSLTDPTAVNEVTAKFNDLSKHITDLKNKNTDLTQEEIKHYNSLRNELDLLIQKYRDIETANSVSNKVSHGISKLQAEINASKTQWSKMLNDPGIVASINAIESALAKVGNDPAKLEEQIRQWGILKYHIRETENNQRSLADAIANTGKRLASYMVNMLSYRLIFGSLRSGLKTILDVNNAMTELRMVTQSTGEEYNMFFENAVVSAIKLGTSIDGLIKSTTSFVRLGYSFADASILSEYASILSAVGQMDISASTESLVSQMKAFGVAAQDALRIVDLLTVSDSNLATTANDVAEGMKRSSAALAAAGNSMEQSVAMFNAVFGVLQNAEQSATVLRTISMRLRNTAGQLEELGEDSTDATESITKLQTQLLNLTDNKVDIMLNSDTFHDTFDIMDQLYEVWDDLSDKAQADIIRLVAGLRNAQGFSALLSNWEDARTSIELFGSASGDAIDKFAEASDSASHRIAVFKAQFQALATGVVDSGFVKFMIDAGTAIVSFFTLGNTFFGKLVAWPIAISAVTAALKTLGAFKFIKGIGGHCKSYDSLFLGNRLTYEAA